MSKRYFEVTITRVLRFELDQTVIDAVAADPQSKKLWPMKRDLAAYIGAMLEYGLPLSEFFEDQPDENAEFSYLRDETTARNEQSL